MRALLLVRLNPVFAANPSLMFVIASVGALTAFIAGTTALVQRDIKKVLAYSTVSQLGYLFFGVGTGAYAAGIFHLVTHAIDKALLFLGAGSVIHAMHHAYHHTHRHADPQDMRNMGGLARHLPVTYRTMWVARLAIAGIPPLAGFFSKDEMLWGAWSGGHKIVWGALAFAAGLTAFYMFRLFPFSAKRCQRSSSCKTRGSPKVRESRL